MKIAETVDRSAAVDEVPRLEAEPFFRDYVRSQTPVVLRGCLADTKMCRTWSPQYLRERVGDKNVRVNHNVRGVYDYSEGAETGKVETLEMTFGEAVDLICGDSATGRTYYVQQQPIAKGYPELMKEVEIPECIDGRASTYAVNLWFGGAGCVSPLHFDQADGLLAQVAGRKDITLFAPSDSDNLYRRESPRHLSQVNWLEPDFEKFPLLKNVTPIQFVLEPGDLLYIPRHWWHFVRSLDVSISVNYWWGKRFSASTLKVKLAGAYFRLMGKG